MAVYAFSMLLGVGATAGLLWVAWRGGRSLPSDASLQPVNAGLWACLGALAGGRAAFVAVNWPYFRAQPQETVQIFLGGLSWPGALLGGLLALALYAWARRQSLGRLADALLPLLATLTVCAWLACWLDGYAYGEAHNAWWALPSLDEWGVLQRRTPVQLLGALLSLQLFWLLDRDWKRPRFAGEAAAWGLLGLAVQLLVTSLLRADPAPIWQGLRLDTWAALALTMLFGIPLFVVSLQRLSARA